MMGRGQSRAGQIELKLLVSVGSRLHSIKRVVRVGPMEQKQVLEGCEINQQMSGEDMLISRRVMGQSKEPSQECVWPVQEIGETEGGQMVLPGWEECGWCRWEWTTMVAIETGSIFYNVEPSCTYCYRHSRNSLHLLSIAASPSPRK